MSIRRQVDILYSFVISPIFELVGFIAPELDLKKVYILAIVVLDFLASNETVTSFPLRCDTSAKLYVIYVDEFFFIVHSRISLFLSLSRYCGKPRRARTDLQNPPWRSLPADFQAWAWFWDGGE